MASNQNWTHYEVDIGWKEVTASEVFSKSIILKLLDDTLTESYLDNILDLDGFLADTLTKSYLNNIMNPSYSNGKLKFNE